MATIPHCGVVRAEIFRVVGLASGTG
jgi:hypothetical protein